jgi:hypothetical protein
MSQNENLIVPQFKTITTLNEGRSKKAGCPKFDDVEVVEIRMAANKETVGVFPAHEVWKLVDQPDGTREPTTYAMRWPDLYRKFKMNETQDLSGTPLAEAPFLTQAKRMELKALNIHTVEALAAVDGQPLNMLGMGGREMKNQAQAYLAKASDSAVETRLAAENVGLKQQLADMQAQINAMNQKVSKKRADKASDSADGDAAGDDETGTDATETEGASGGEGDNADNGNVSPFDDWEDEDIKLWISEETGSKPKGNPNHKTLVRMADEINDDLTRKAEEAAGAA